MKKLEDIVLKKGDIVYFKDGTKDKMEYDRLTKIGDYFYKQFIENIEKIERPIGYTTIYEAQHEILDKEEKEWLKHFLRPFRNKVEYIIKYKV